MLYPLRKNTIVLIMTVCCHHRTVIARVFLVHLMNAEQCEMAASHTSNQLTWAESLPVSAIN